MFYDGALSLIYCDNQTGVTDIVETRRLHILIFYFYRFLRVTGLTCFFK